MSLYSALFKKLNNMEKRKAEVERYKRIWLTKEAHKILKVEKKKQAKTLVRIVDDLIKEKYEI